jgi:hypothetical protein
LPPSIRRRRPLVPLLSIRTGRPRALLTAAALSPGRPRWRGGWRTSAVFVLPAVGRVPNGAWRSTGWRPVQALIELLRLEVDDLPAAGGRPNKRLARGLDALHLVDCWEAASGRPWRRGAAALHSFSEGALILWRCCGGDGAELPCFRALVVGLPGKSLLPCPSLRRHLWELLSGGLLCRPDRNLRCRAPLPLFLPPSSSGAASGVVAFIGDLVGI